MKIETRNLSFKYNDKEKVLDEISLEFPQNEISVIIGESGCGKSTFLKLLAGLLEESDGEIFFDDEKVERLGKVSYMPQKDLLLPWRTVRENAVLGLELKKVATEEALRKADEALEEFGLAEYSDFYPRELSGGMRQRTAFVRNIIAGFQTILLDEPFSALDAITRLKLQKWLMKVKLEKKLTIILITHDIDEALLLGKKIYIFKKGVAKVKELHNHMEYPRDEDIFEEEDFLKLKREIMRSFKDEKE